MDLKDEVKEIYNTRPTRAERAKRREEEAQKRQESKGPKGRRKFFPQRKPYAIAVLVISLLTAVFLLLMIMLNIFPPDLTVILSVLILALLALTSFLLASDKKVSRIFGIVIAALLIVITGSITNFMGNTYAMLGKISLDSKTATGPLAKRVDVTDEPFNIYITGIDQWESEKGLDLERSDVNMIMTINPVTRKILLTSIPRDTYVKLHTAQQMDKLTHSGVYGVDETLNTVEDWLGIEINYYVKVNFSAVRHIIDAMGGITVYSPVAFKSDISKYEYQKGWNRMGGKRALYFVRERHAFEGQDSVRVENQQRVLKAMIKKLTTSPVLITRCGEILDAAGDNLSTNMSSKDMQALVRMQIGDLGEWDIQSQKITGEYDMDYVASLSSKRQYSIYRADPSSVSKCKKEIKAVEDPPRSEMTQASLTRHRSFIVNVIRHLTQKKDGSSSAAGK